MREELRGDRVAGLVIGCELPGLVADLAALLLGAHLDLEDGLLDVLHRDEAVLAAHSQQGRLVHQVLQIRAGEAGRAAGDGVEVHVVSELLVAGMDSQNGLTALDIGQADIDLAVEAAGAQQGVIQDIGAVRGRHDDDALVAAEAVHLDEQLVEGLLALVVAAAEAAASLPADGVDLVDKDDRGGELLGLLEQIAHTPGADADIELDKVRAGDRQELHLRLARDGLGQQRFAGARRADEQHALGDARAHRGVGLRILEEVDDLGQLFLFLVAAGHVREGLFVLLLAAEAGARAAEAGHHRVEDPDHHADQQQVRDDLQPPGRSEALLVVVLLDDALFFLLGDQLVEVLIKDGEADKAVFLRLQLFLAGDLVRLPGVELEHDVVALGDEGLHLLLPEELDQVGVDHRLFPGGAQQ